MSSEPLLKTFRAITSAEAVGQDHPEHMTVLRTFISAPARSGSGVSGMSGMERLADIAAGRDCGGEGFHQACERLLARPNGRPILRRRIQAKLIIRLAREVNRLDLILPAN